MTEELNQIPNISNPLSAPLLNLEEIFSQQHDTIEEWFRSQWQQTPAAFYASVDLRNSGYKVAPVDTNLFPAGFNNLSHAFSNLASEAVKHTLEKISPQAQTILLIPEDHTRNLKYLENVLHLQEIISNAGYHVEVGSLREDIKAKERITLEGQDKTLTLNPLRRDNDQLLVGTIPADLVILNNDLSSGVPDIISQLDTPILPSAHLGWSTRLKSKHFALYKDVAEELAAKIGLDDAWLINPVFSHCGEINFKTRSGEDCLVRHVTKVLNQIETKYKQYSIKERPYAVVKTDSGSYGMGVMIVHEPEEITTLNRKQRNNMAITKGKQSVSNVIIQEGVYTFETVDDAYAEPVVYMIGECVVGGFYRIHTAKGANQNLNAPGMHFKPLAFTSCCNSPKTTQNAKRFYLYGVIARLAMIAASRELYLVNQEYTS